MFPQFKKLNNESGIVLFIVLMTAIIIMIFSVGVLTQSMNEMNYAQQQIDQLASQQWSKGIFWNAYSNGYFASGPAGVVGIGTEMQGRSYQTSITVLGGNAYSVSSSYDSFQ